VVWWTGRRGGYRGDGEGCAQGAKTLGGDQRVSVRLFSNISSGADTSTTRQSRDFVFSESTSSATWFIENDNGRDSDQTEGSDNRGQ
jgi:hypothetical protein